MSYFLSPHALSPGAVVTLDGAEAAHISRARRMRPGEVFELQDPEGRRFDVEFLPAARGAVSVRVLRPAPLPPPPSLELTLLQGAVKDKAAEAILRQATELGVSRLLVFHTDHAPGRARELDAPRERERWNRIAWEACKQSGRPAPPELTRAVSLAAALALLPAALAPGWVLHPTRGLAPPEALRAFRGQAVPGQAWLAVGPEGGFSEAELARLLAAGMTPVTLPGPILRTETAALTGCALMLHGCWGAPAGS